MSDQRVHRRTTRWRLCSAMPALLVVLSLTGCGGGSGLDGGSAVRLIDEFSTEVVTGTPVSTDVGIEVPEWRFDGRAARVGRRCRARCDLGLGGGSDVTGLQVANGTLSGVSAGVFPILRAERVGVADEQDTLHAVEIRARVSDGENLWVEVRSGDVDVAEMTETGREAPWRLVTPLQAGDDAQTYIVTPAQPIPMSAVGHVLLSPTDAEGAAFDIEYVRVISRRQHLASVASGIGWQGLDEIYHETLVARAPETLL